MELAVKRILIALDSSRRGQSALQAAARLAAGTGAELADLLVMAKSERLVRFASSRPQRCPETPMFALFDPGVVGYRILAAGLKLAQSLGVGLAVLIAARTLEEFKLRREAALAGLGGQTVSARVLWLAAPEPGELGALVRSGRGAALVLHETSLPAARAALDALLEAVVCPLIVVL